MALSKSLPKPPEVLSALLREKSSGKRRQAAKALRKHPDPQMVGELIDALEREIRDPRTWETQYHMIMALAACEGLAGRALLGSIASMSLEHSMVLVAVGDAITTLQHRAGGDPVEPLLQWMQDDSKALVEGGLRAIAQQQLVPECAVVEQIIEYVSRPDNAALTFWVAAASAGWQGPAVSEFLSRCAADPLEDTRKAAQASGAGKYQRWSIL